MAYEFLKQAARILNSGQSRVVVLTGAIQDLYFSDDDSGGQYVPLVSFIRDQWDLPGRILLIYEINGPIRFLEEAHRSKIKDAWLKLRTGLNANQIAIERMLSSSQAFNTEISSGEFDSNLERAVGRPTLALEMLRQMCLCSRTELDGEVLLPEDLIIVIEGADMLLPDAPITQLSDADRHRVAICQDWFCDPGFIDGQDAVVLLSETKSMLHQRIASMPQVLEVQAHSAKSAHRAHYVDWFQAQNEGSDLGMAAEELVSVTAGLSIHALAQLLKGAYHSKEPLSPLSVINKVEQYVQSQLGEDVVEFKKPSHQLDDVVGFEQLKMFLRSELIPRFRSSGEDALPGAAVCGPIGSGKTFIFEAVAAELDMVVLVLKNIRSKWFGQTDVIFERLRRVLEDLSKVLIFVDEADTQFGGVGSDAHPTERRLTGKIQAMMSDPRLRGQVIWLLMTARIHLLSPDIRRPGRTGDLIIPVLDPKGEDREAFVRWLIEPVLEAEVAEDEFEKLLSLTEGYSAAAFAALRSELKAKAAHEQLDVDRIIAIVSDHIPPAIGLTRRYQTLQALVNCTRRSLLPSPDIDESTRAEWQAQIRALEQQGIR